jgi:D-alanyl-D-alanine carboxypeptidase (penicillin-binding protein 5/6)
LRRIEDNDEGINVVCGKTGFVNQSGSCAVSYAESENGEPYILCTGNSSSSWQCIGDQTILYADAMQDDNMTGYSVSAAESNSGGIDEE